MSITKTLANEAPLPITTGTATSFSQASVVRLVNTHASNAYVVSVVETQSGTVVGTFTLGNRGSLPGGGDGDVIIEKEYSQCVFANGASVKAVSVGIVGY